MLLVTLGALMACRPDPPLPDPPGGGGGGTTDTTDTTSEADPWDLWDAGDLDDACPGFEVDDDDLGLGWCALAEGDLDGAVGHFGAAGDGTDAKAGLALALELTGRPQDASAAAHAVLTADSDYTFEHAPVDADDMWRLRTQAALLRGDLLSYRLRAAQLGLVTPSPYDPGEWTSAGAWLTAALMQLEVAP